MLNTIIDGIKKIFKKIQLSKINYLNHKFKKYIIKFEEADSKLKIYNSSGNYKIVENTVPNKVKVMEIIKEHQKEIETKIFYYDKLHDDNIAIILSSSSLLIVLGFVVIFSFFVGNYIFLFSSLFSFSMTLILFILNTNKILMFREEVKRLKLIRENKYIFDDNELKDIIIDVFIIIKDKFYSFIVRFLDMFEKRKVKS